MSLHSAFLFFSFFTLSISRNLFHSSDCAINLSELAISRPLRTLSLRSRARCVLIADSLFPCYQISRSHHSTRLCISFFYFKKCFLSRRQRPIIADSICSLPPPPPPPSHHLQLRGVDASLARSCSDDKLSPCDRPPISQALHNKGDFLASSQLCNSDKPPRRHLAGACSARPPTARRLLHAAHEDDEDVAEDDLELACSCCTSGVSCTPSCTL